MQNNEKKLRVVHLFSGIGAPERALTRLKIPFEIVGYSEIDKYAIKAYKALNGDVPSLGDATQIDFSQIDTRGIDLVIGGFPCQAFSAAGKRAGFDDLRGTMCFHMAKAIKELRPKYFLFENVQGLLTHDKGKTIRVILEVFSGLGYEITMDMLNAKDYLVPQNRSRIFCLGRRIDDCQ